MSLPPQSLLVERNPSAATCVSGRRLHILYLAELSAINKARIFYCAGCIMFLGALRTATFHSRHQGICCFICNGPAIAFTLPEAYTPFPSGRVLVRSAKYSQASDMLPGQIIQFDTRFRSCTPRRSILRPNPLIDRSAFWFCCPVCISDNRGLTAYPVSLKPVRGF